MGPNRHDPWPKPRRRMSAGQLLEASDEYERRALAITSRDTAYKRCSFTCYRTLAAQLRGWHEEQCRSRASIEIPLRRAASSVFREALQTITEVA